MQIPPHEVLEIIVFVSVLLLLKMYIDSALSLAGSFEISETFVSEFLKIVGVF